MDRQVKKFSQEDEDSLPGSGTNGSGILTLQGHNNNISSNLQHNHHPAMGIIQDNFHSESDDEVMILEHG